MSAHEPSTRHFSAVELAAFLETLEQGERRVVSPVREVRARVRMDEPATVLGEAPLAAVGTPVWRASSRRRVSEPSPRRDVSADVSRTALLREPPAALRTAPIPRSVSEVRSSVSLRMRELPHARAFRNRRWRLAFFAMMFACTTLWAGLCARGVSHTRKASAHAVRAATPPVEPAPPVLMRASHSSVALASLPQRAQPVSRSEGELAGERRRAVDLLMAGRTRQAVEVYRAWLGGAHVDTVELSAIQQIVSLLEHELSACERLLGSPCGG